MLPPLVPLSSEVLFPSGAYLLDNGRVFVLWLGREVSSHFLHEVCPNHISVLMCHICNGQGCFP